MSAPKWTPGPWRMIEPTAIGYCVPADLRGVGDDSLVAMAAGGGPKRAVGAAEARANAHLIAAAPELYAQLEDARITLDEAAKVLAREHLAFANNTVNQCAIRCSDVLAKARGER